MNTVIAFYIIGYIFFSYLIYRENNGWSIEMIIFPIFQSLAAASIGLIIAIMLPVKYETTSWSKNLVTLKDNNNLSGGFFLGTGIINGSMKYVYYQKNDDSTYQMWQADYYKAKIRYTRKQPMVIILDTHESKTTLNKWALDIFDKNNQTYIFEVPEGAIKNNYELDAQ